MARVTQKAMSDVKSKTVKRVSVKRVGVKQVGVKRVGGSHDTPMAPRKTPLKSRSKAKSKPKSSKPKSKAKSSKPKSSKSKRSSRKGGASSRSLIGYVSDSSVESEIIAPKRKLRAGGSSRTGGFCYRTFGTYLAQGTKIVSDAQDALRKFQDSNPNCVGLNANPNYQKFWQKVESVIGELKREMQDPTSSLRQIADPPKAGGVGSFGSFRAFDPVFYPEFNGRVGGMGYGPVHPIQYPSEFIGY